MALDTAGAVLGFLGLVAPGLVYELLREKRRPAITETAFREAARVALTSLIFTGISLALLTIIRLALPLYLPDPGAWLREGANYARRAFWPITLGLAVEVTLACSLAVLTHVVLNKSGIGQARIQSGSIWYHVLRGDRPKAAKNVLLRLRLSDGTRVKGVMRWYTQGEKLDDQELALGGAGLELAPPEGDFAPIGEQADFLVVRGDRIVAMSGVYTTRQRDGTWQIYRRNGQTIDRSTPAPEKVSDGAAMRMPVRSGARQMPDTSPRAVAQKEGPSSQRALTTLLAIVIAILVREWRLARRPSTRS
jgi:hypothetical protein